MYICRNCRTRLTRADTTAGRNSSLAHSSGLSRPSYRDANPPQWYRARRVANLWKSGPGCDRNVQRREYSVTLLRSQNRLERAMLLYSSDSRTRKRMLSSRTEVVPTHYRKSRTGFGRSHVGNATSSLTIVLSRLKDVRGGRMDLARELLREAHALQFRHFHAPSFLRQTSSATVQNRSEIPDVSYRDAQTVSRQMKSVHLSGIRAELKAWHVLHADDEANYRQVDFEHDHDTDAPRNDFVRLSNKGPSTARREQFSGDQSDDDPSELFMNSPDKDLDEAPMSKRFLEIGDLVELSSTWSNREAEIAVFVRRVGNMAQFLTAQGRWTHREEKMIQYSIPHWFSRSLVEPLIEHMPNLEEGENLQKLLDDAYLHDMSVPRRVSAPLVQRMQQFQTKSRNIYRRHAQALDNAHDILAHDTELRYGSLTSAASTLLGIPADDLPIVALWTTRSALTQAGYAFVFDVRSHRLTGNMQILSKEQVNKVKAVREWFRAWLDDLARVSIMTESQRSRHRPTKGAQHMYNFVDKVKKVIKNNRKHRVPSICAAVGPSKERYPITPQNDSVRIKTDVRFSEQDAAILQFMQDWCCSLQLDSQQQLLSLPPLLLQNTGLYAGYGLNKSTGFMFLQEVGTLLPYENRVTLDPHLSSPMSQSTMDSPKEMGHSHDFQDSMIHLRKDWKNLPVFCIDAEGSQEIDDGMSVESCGTGPDGREQYWVHVHIANPTAFFSKDHPLAEMAGHLTETIYTPERNQTMLPRWLTSNHFSLERDRPCLTFSAKMDLDGKTLEHDITPGIIRNVFHLSHENVADILNINKTKKANQIVMTVGGNLPPRSERTSRVTDVTADVAEQLKILRHLAQKRSAIRQAAGGLFLDVNKPEAEVWQSWNGPGLPLQQPYYRGCRTVHGDPVIRFTTSGISNWYTASEDETGMLVQETMLLACEIGGSWCAERNIPFIYRGSMRRPDSDDPEKFLRDVLEPAAKKSPSGEWPLHRAHQYVTTFGYTVLTTEPLKHRLLGLSHYGKVTSPLRRYGDMVVHWQIGAALLEEARTGQSLITENRRNLHLSFLPFSKEDLEKIMVGLQSRENLIMRAKRYSQDFWIHMLLFRAIHYGETEVPLSLGPAASTIGVLGWRKRYETSPPRAHPSNQRYIVRMYIHSVPKPQSQHVNGVTMEFNTGALMVRPDNIGLEAAQHGDVWEAQVEEVNVFVRTMFLWPTRLLERDGQRVDN